ncbi:GumC family protein [Acidithiobacillus thiooxidans]|uniref:non-specific protein-tyrosine kinase n=1 Tax=Acidithiobacillus thiooxidans ATCC 19377 TaxID=637390 RepID=A0A543Q4E6_ACITH|nr:polysaccharide biosynthesis tyrosine autokinase [Acidithiobacillus thiooxidans]MDX5934675.1 polysaccharide biosynthesis tyrosine autokinase [Acidithiobacillus thiooxidans]TQN51202.1 Tyrosine-protein kinase wzc [Acidithiobacillus thiooxidans ATCC 19377]
MTDQTENMPSNKNELIFDRRHFNNAVDVHDEGDKIDLSALIQSLKLHWRWPVGLTGAGVVLAGIITFNSVPVFESSGSIYLGNAEKDASLANANANVALLAGLSQAPNIDTQIQIMGSRDIIEKAISRSGMNVSIFKMHESPKIHYWGWWSSGHSMSIYKPLKDSVRANLVKVDDTKIYGKKLDLLFFESGNYEIKNGKKLLLKGVLGLPAVAPDLSLVLKLNEQHFIPKKGDNYHMVVQSPLMVYREINDNISISEAGQGDGSAKSFLVNLTFKNANPFVSQKFLNSLMLTYLDQTQAWSSGEAATTYGYLNTQLDKVRSALETADKHLAGYQSRSGVLSVTSNAQALITQMANYESQKSELELKLNSLQQLSAELDTSHTKINPYLVSSVSDTVLNGLSDKLIVAENKKSSLSTLYKPAAPEMIQIKSEVSSIQSAIRNVISNQKTATYQELNSLDAAISRYKERMGQYPKEALQVLSLTRSSEVLGKLYMFLLEKQEEAAISQANTVTKNRILDTAIVHDLPISPVGGRNILMGGFLGLLIGLSIVFAKFLAYKGFHSEEEIERRYPALPLFGIIPEYTDFNPASRTIKPSKILVPEARSGYGEAMRLLRSKLYLDISSGKNSGRVLMLSSASQGDGKSTVGTQLAIALAQDGKRVLIIDADLRKPHLHEVLQAKQKPGLVDYLADNADWKSCLNPIDLKLPTDAVLDLIPAGEIPPSPAELIGQARMEELINQAREEYNYILIDTAPYPMVSDGLTIATLVDRVLSVVKVGQTARGGFHDHVQGIIQMNRPRGLIINATNKINTLGYNYGGKLTLVDRLKLAFKNLMQLKNHK